MIAWRPLIHAKWNGFLALVVVAVDRDAVVAGQEGITNKVHICGEEASEIFWADLSQVSRSMVSTEVLNLVYNNLA